MMPKPANTPRFAISPEMLNILAVLVMLALHNGTMFGHAASLSVGWGLFLAFLVMAFAANLAVVTILSLLLVPVLQRLVVFGLVVLSSITSYFTDNLGVIYQTDLVAAVVTSTTRESSTLVDGGVIWHAVLWGVLPAALLLALPLKRRTWARNGISWLLMVVLAYGLAVAARNASKDDFRKLSQRDLDSVTFSLQPGAFVGAMAQIGAEYLETIGMPFVQVGLDAHAGPRLAAAQKPVVVFLVLGESARADHWQINGYDRPTTPELAKIDIVNLGTATSCATSTRPSLRCLFSNLGRAGFTNPAAITRENLLDVVQHAGLQVNWYSNNNSPTGQGVANRITIDLLYSDTSRPGCEGKECLDSVFHDVLAQLIETTDQNKLVILHLAGSHFLYADRYPPEFERFTPACNKTIASQCTREETVNAYDNSILYTDHILASFIQMLTAQDKILPALLYVSDHGESLGENGVYAHSAPVATAPPEQFNVPFFLWFSRPYAQAFGLDLACLRAKAETPSTHDNVFHTVLGLLDIETQDRLAALDLTSGCLH